MTKYLAQNPLNKLIESSCLFANQWKGLKMDLIPEKEVKDFVQIIKENLKDLRIDNFKNNPSFNYFYPKVNEISSVEIFNNDSVVIMMMLMPDEYFLEYHDHPNMIGVLKLIEGEMTLSNLDLIDQDEFYKHPKEAGKCLKVKNVSQKELKNGDMSEVFPHFENIHSMFSRKRCIVLDVLINYYNEERPCSYFAIKKTLNDPSVIEGVKFLRME